MINEPRRIKVAPESELARLLTEASDMPLILEKNGEVYQLSRVEEEGKGYDPEKALAGMKAAAGSWKDIDTEAFKQYIYRSRKEGTRPPDSP